MFNKSNFTLSLLLLLLFFAKSAKSQNNITLTHEEWQEAKEFAILPDKNYSFAQILSDSTLHFVKNDTINPYQTPVYWVRFTVYNPSAYSERFVIRFFPNIQNTLYAFDVNQKKWLQDSVGILVESQKMSNYNLPCILQGQQATTFYIKTQIKPLVESHDAIKASLRLVKESFFIKRTEFANTTTFVTILIVLAFLLFNAYIYYLFRDKTYIYYFVTQIGGILYVIAENQYLNMLLKTRFACFEIEKLVCIWFYDLNIIALRFASALVLFGFVQLTRNYLSTKVALPFYDKWLKYALMAYVSIVFGEFFMIINGLVPIKNSFALCLNVLCVLIMLAIICVCILRLREGYQPARYLLIANLIAFVLVLCLGVYFAFYPAKSGSLWEQMANIAVIAQAICLAAALAERMLLIRDELKQKQMEAQELAFQTKKLTFQNSLQQAENNLLQEKLAANERELALQNSLHQAENELLQEKLESNQRELASATLYISQKNELLSSLKTHFEVLRKKLPATTQVLLKSIESLIKNNQYLDDDWERFRIHFEQVHPDFFKNLEVKHPNLTKNEVRLCAYFHINLSTKEIAALLNINPASVRKAKMRLGKKINEEVSADVID